jgi:hypothetical protein
VKRFKVPIICLAVLAAGAGACWLLVPKQGESGLPLKKEQELIAIARKDFLAGSVGNLDFAMAVIKMAEAEGTDPLAAEKYADAKVTGGRIFDYVELPDDDAIWAVELDLTARAREGGEAGSGVAILQYGSFVVNGARQKAGLMFSQAAYTQAAIEKNRQAVRASLDSCRAMKRAMR